MSCISGGEFPSQKLQALQRILQSDFLTAVREVYENVYETVDLSGSAEIRANATAKVSVRNVLFNNALILFTVIRHQTYG